MAYMSQEQKAKFAPQPFNPRETDSGLELLTPKVWFSSPRFSPNFSIEILPM